jgi:hypothetical protein
MSNVLGGPRDHPRQSPEQFSETNAGGLDRRAFLAAGATATVLVASPSFAQSQPQVASAPTPQGAMPNNVRVERLDGSILLIGIRQESDRVELSSVIGLGCFDVYARPRRSTACRGPLLPGPRLCRRHPRCRQLGASFT